jgi:hypothetical protein
LPRCGWGRSSLGGTGLTRKASFRSPKGIYTSMPGDDAVQEAPSAHVMPSSTSATPRQALWVSIYHALILIIGLWITTYSIGPDHLIACSQAPPSQAGSVVDAAAAMGIGNVCHTKPLLVLVFALCFGMIGSALNASRYVVLAVRHKRYDSSRILWQILTPLHGGVLAVVAVYVVIGGLFSVVQAAAVNQQYGYFIGGFSFLVGFSSELFVKRLMAATEALFGELKAKSDAENVETISSGDSLER